VQRVDRGVGVVLALLGVAVMQSARAFPNVPGQKLGAGFLPMIVGAGLVACAVGLLMRAHRSAPGPAAAAQGSVWPALVIMASIAVYVALAERLGFLLVAPVVLLAGFRALSVAWLPALLWALGGTLAVHVAFYKLLRVPLPWGVLRPLY
jgi:putative tricarboxylic transport membrane protein